MCSLDKQDKVLLLATHSFEDATIDYAMGQFGTKPLPQILLIELS